jgi:membrane-associated phospholipid phosphatase
LFLPLAWLLPRWRWPLVVIPWFIAVARVDANHHFISDVGVSIAMAALLTLALARVALPAERARSGSDVQG